MSRDERSYNECERQGVRSRLHTRPAVCAGRGKASESQEPRQRGRRLPEEEARREWVEEAKFLRKAQSPWARWLPKLEKIQPWWAPPKFRETPDTLQVRRDRERTRGFPRVSLSCGVSTDTR